MSKLTVELSSVKTMFESIFGSKNYFDVEIPTENIVEIGNEVGPQYSKYDRCTAGYETNSGLSRLLGQILTVIDASVDSDKKEHVKSIIRQLYYPGVRRLNDDMFDMIDRELNR